jgi:hypothetical protein
MVFETQGSVNVDIKEVVLSVLSKPQSKDAIDVFQDTKRAVRTTVEERLGKLAAPLRAVAIVHAEVSENSSLNYDFVLRILNELVQSGQAKETGQSGVPRYLRMK